MPRSGRLRSFIKEYSESPRVEKISFIPPFIILTIEIILIAHAIAIGESYVIMLTSILVIVSAIEIILVAGEIHDHYRKNNFGRELIIRLDDFIIDKNKKNVQRIVEQFIDIHPNYGIHRNEIYRIACQIMETHKEELWERTLDARLKICIKKSKNQNLRGIIENFVEKYPEYKRNPEKVYQLAAQMIEKYTKHQEKKK